VRSHNGELISLVEGQFDVFLTTDQNIRYQQNLSERSLRFVVLVASNNEYKTLAPLMPKVLEALQTIKLGELQEVS